MNRCWEILIPRDEFDEFTAFMDKHGYGGFTASTLGDHFWILCYPSEDVRVISKLRFNITELPYYGTEINFTDYPSG